MNRIFTQTFRNLERNKIVLRYFCEKTKLNQTKSDYLSKYFPEKSISYQKKLDDIIITITNIHQNSNFLNVFVCKYFKSYEQLKQESMQDEIGVPVFSHTTSKRYYIINALFLGVYIVYAYYINTNEDIPSSIQNTTLGFSIVSAIVLLLMYIYSKKHVKILYYLKNSRNFNIETYFCFGLINRNYTIPIKDLKKVVPLFKGNYQSRSGIFSLEFETSGKKRVFFFRPQEIHNKELFDTLIKRKIEV